MKKLLFVLTIILLNTHCKAQWIGGIEFGAGSSFNKLKEQDTVDNLFDYYKFKSKRNFAFTATFITNKNRIINFGAQLTFNNRKFIQGYKQLNMQRYGDHYASTYLYVTPTLDFCFDKHRYLHAQIIVPIGFFLSGNTERRFETLDPVTGQVSYEGTSSDSSFSNVNYRLGGNIYGQLPLGRKFSAIAKIEYSASMNKLATFRFYDIRPSDLLFKLGLMYQLGK